MTKKFNISVDDLNRHVKDTHQTFALMMTLGGLTEGDGRNHSQPCPYCGGTDRCWYSDDCGRVFCRHCKSTGGYNLYDIVQHNQGIGFTEALELIARESGFIASVASRGMKSAPQKSVAKQKRFRAGSVKKTEYIYKREDGKPSHKVVRIEGIDESTGKPGKTFSQWKYQDGQWARGKPDITVPYRLPEVLEAETLFIVEGEKVADCLNRVLWAAGSETAVATTSPMGALNAKQWEKYLKRVPSIVDKRIIILADNDEAGTKYARTVAVAIREVNPEANVRIVVLPDLPEGGDFVDWYAEMKENDKDESAVTKALKALCKNTEAVTPEEVATWEQSEPADNTSERSKWQPFPLETLPRKLRLYVKQVARSIGIDPAYVAASVLSIVSGVIGRTFVIEIKKGYQEYAMLWVAVVADSGFGKSPALTFPRQPIDLLERDVRKKYKEDYAKYKAQSKGCSNQQASEQNEDNAEQEIIAEPTMQRFVVSNTTSAALVPILSDNPFGLCLIRDELAAFFGAIDGYNKAKFERQFYIEIHGGIPVMIDRKSGKRHIAADTPSLSIVGGIQSDILRQTIAREPDFLATGFGARFLMTYPPSIPIYWNHNEIADDVLSPYEELLDKLVACRESFTPDAPGIVRLTPGAGRLIFDFQNRQADKTLNILDGNVRYVFNKAGMHAARLALVLHVVECLEKGFDSRTKISPETMQHAITLTKWFLNEARLIYAMLAKESTSGKKLEVCDELLLIAKIQQKGGKTTFRELRKKFSSTSKYRQPGGAEELDRKLREMEKAGLLVIQHEGKKELFCIPPDTNEV